ncbi:LysR family transcriptional regulator [Kribbella sp. NPDC051587]|uniref:LysR family transcriptional regulator n=1 Tax=Kribbella sp. NPDC051587 TaxID=3364119 RepID=UPI0037874866
MDLGAVRTFVAVADAGQFQAAADELGVTQQAVSKRIATLERHLQVSLFVRSARGTQLSADGQAFLPHARELLQVAERAVSAVQSVRRPLRVDVLNRRTAPATALHAFHQSRPDVELDVVTLPDADLDTVVAAVASGTIDATFRSPRHPLALPVKAARAIDDAHELLVGPRHPLADASTLTPADLVEHRLWIPGMKPGTEWALYYEELARTFALSIDTAGPTFSAEVLLGELAASATLATLVGTGSRYLWPESYDLRRIPIVNPTPIYPHFVIWHTDNPHPALTAFLDHLRAAHTSPPDSWLPTWARAGQ